MLGFFYQLWDLVDLDGWAEWGIALWEINPIDENPERFAFGDPRIRNISLEDVAAMSQVLLFKIEVGYLNLAKDASSFSGI